MTLIGIGTHAPGKSLAQILPKIVRDGFPLIDTAPNYRNGWCHKEIAKLNLGAERTTRLSTKVGCLRHNSISDALDEKFRASAKRGVVLESDYLRQALLRNREELGVQPDITYLHNFEVFVNEPNFEILMRGAVEQLEQAVADGLTGAYGFATWNWFVEAPRLTFFTELVCEVADSLQNFKAIQMPVSIARPQAAIAKVTRNEGVISEAVQSNIEVHVSSPFDFGRIFEGKQADAILGPIKDGLGLKSETSIAEIALRFLLSIEGISYILVGISSADNYQKLLMSRNYEQLDTYRFEKLLKYLDGRI